MTFLEPDLFRMLCFKTVLCHEMVVTSRQVFDKLKSLKRKIKTILPTAVVGFVRIPTLSFVKAWGVIWLKQIGVSYGIASSKKQLLYIYFFFI
jgi:hypothetical protein